MWGDIMTTLEQIQFNIRQLFNGNHLSESELIFTKQQLESLLLDVEKRLIN